MRARPLFSHFPKLEAALAPLELCTLPTRVHALPSVGAHAWVKRDDETHPEYGGNKMRKLEYVAAELVREKKTRAILFGATGTNAGVATAMVCRDLGMQCDILTFTQPGSSTVERNRALMRHYGARLVHTGSLLSTVLAWQCHPRRLDRRTGFLFAGCSNPVATFAYVDAAFELKQQIERGECPAPAGIVVAAGSCSTLAGLTLGCALAGLDARVVGVRVSPARVGPFAACAPSTVVRMMRACRDTIARAHPSALPPLPEAIVDGAWFGDGYGAATDEGRAAIEAFAREGIATEQTYTGKAAAAFLALARASHEPVLFWNTFSARPDPPGFSR